MFIYIYTKLYMHLFRKDARYKKLYWQLPQTYYTQIRKIVDFYN